jgi:hypothetical protein
LIHKIPITKWRKSWRHLNGLQFLFSFSVFLFSFFFSFFEDSSNERHII